MAAVALTNSQINSLKSSTVFREYLQDAVLGDDTGGCGYLLRLASTVDLVQFVQLVVARQIEKNQSILTNDSNLVPFIILRMVVRDIDKLDNAVVGGEGRELEDQVIAYLNASNRINLLVADYLAEKGKAF